MVLFQPSAHLAGLNPDYRVVSRGIPCRPLEKLGSDRALLQGFVAVLQRMLHDVGQKLFATVAGAKEGATQDGFQLPEDCLFLGRGRLHRPRSFRCTRNCRAAWNSIRWLLT